MYRLIGTFDREETYILLSVNDMRSSTKDLPRDACANICIQKQSQGPIELERIGTTISRCAISLRGIVLTLYKVTAFRVLLSQHMISETNIPGRRRDLTISGSCPGSQAFDQYPN